MKEATRQRIEELERRVRELEQRQGPLWVVSPDRYVPPPVYHPHPGYISPTFPHAPISTITGDTAVASSLLCWNNPAPNAEPPNVPSPSITIRVQ